MIALDASVVIAALDSRDAHHNTAAALLREHFETGFRMHPLTVSESLVSAVQQGRGQQVVADLAALNIHTAAVRPTEPLHLAELRVKTGLRLPDCCVLVVALSEIGGLATFDKRLAAAAESLGVRVVG